MIANACPYVYPSRKVCAKIGMDFRRVTLAIIWSPYIYVRTDAKRTGGSEEGSRKVQKSLC